MRSCCFLLSFIFCNFLFAQTYQVPSLVKSHTGFEFPVDLVANSSDDGLYVVELRGEIHYIPELSIDSSVLFGIIPNVRDTFANGVYGMAFHPNYPDSNYLYVHYTYDTSYYDSRLSRFSIVNGEIQLSSEYIIFSDDNLVWFHQGGNPIFGDDGYLYLPKGDGDLNDAPKINGQDPTTFRGAILRLDISRDDFPDDDRRNYGIPPDNPFVSNDQILDEIYAFGFRNPWRISKDKMTGDIYIGEVGWNRYEEVNILECGGNYGWACYEGLYRHEENPCFNDDGINIIDPIFTGMHNEFASITGGFVYRGNKHPDWFGKYILGDFTSGKICFYEEGETSCWDKDNSLINGSFVSFGQSKNLDLYVVDHISGMIYELTKTKFDCSAIPDSIFVDSSIETFYAATDYIGLQVQTGSCTALWSRQVDIFSTTSIETGGELKVYQTNNTCEALIQGKKF